MVAAGREEHLQLASSRPEVGAHCDRLEGIEALGDRPSARLVWSEANQLKNDEIADEHATGSDLSVEPSGEDREAAVAYPGPYTRVEKRRPVERNWLDLNLAAQRTAPGD